MPVPSPKRLLMNRRSLDGLEAGSDWPPIHGLPGRVSAWRLLVLLGTLFVASLAAVSFGSSSRGMPVV